MTETARTVTKDEDVGTRILLEGIAQNAKGGACLILSDNSVIYIDNMLEWEDNYHKTKVIIEGQLVKRKMIPDPVVDKTGAISTGAYGEQLLLENWQIIEKKE